MDWVWKVYQVLAQAIIRDFKLTKNIKPLPSHNFLFIKNWNKENFHFCIRVLYLASFRPRNKKSSHSSFEKTSSEVVWLERKIQSNWVGKVEQSSVYFLLKNVQVISKNVFRDSEMILQIDILRYIKRDIFNPSIRYPKYLKRSLAG